MGHVLRAISSLGADHRDAVDCICYDGFINFSEVREVTHSMTEKTPTKKPPKTVTVFVNNREVELPDREATGAEIKAAAEVPPAFQLYLEHGGKLELIEDDDRIKIHSKQRFRAVSGQDVS